MPTPVMPAPMPGLLAVPAQRLSAIRDLLAVLTAGRRVVLSTHINADGDGCGSEAGFARILAGAGIESRIVNPTPWPGLFDFLLGPGVDDQTARGADALAGADVMVVLDIGDVRRLGTLADAVRALAIPKLVIDHHVAGDEPPGPTVFSDTTACATGELVFDLAVVAGWTITREAATSLYTALLTDTGGFRFSNTSPRCHAIAGYLLSLGIDPEEMYRRVYGSVPIGRLHLLRDALATLDVDPDYAISWISVPAGAVERYGLKSEDLDGIAEHPRSIAGTRLAIFFRDLGHGKVKVSFRSTGGVDVNLLARQFGGGGHAKAAGALVAGSLEAVRTQVIGAARAYIGPQSLPPVASVV
ncbi:MAG: bifunctional oligoribonuclease/PAP phosphatase NrnA [Gemmatimonadales bacterium]